MGCGSSVASTSDAGKHQNSTPHLKEQSSKSSKTISSSISESNNNSEIDINSENEDNEGSRITCRDSGIDSAKTIESRKLCRNHSTENQPKVPANMPTNSKGVAFDVVLDSTQQDSIIKKHPPKRLLQKLDCTPPKLTAEMLLEKQQLTEERRKKIMDRRAKSAKKTSRCRKDILAAKNFSEMAEESMKKINKKMSAADNKRAHVHEGIKSKQRQRETRAKQARERARQLNNSGMEELNYDLEKDETFNNDDSASWLEDDNAEVGKRSTSSERIYDGRSSPVKKFHPTEARKKSHSPNTDSEDDHRWLESSKDHKSIDDFFAT